MQINRLLELVYILLHRKSISAKELAEQLGVSRRTIYRDIDTLGLAGVPVYTEKGKGGGVKLLPDSEAKQVLRQLSAMFNKTAKNWLQVDFSDWSGLNDYFNDFKTAILQRRIVEFDYYNSYGDKTFRQVEPIQLWFKSKSWYVRGFCLAKQDARVYKLSRVKNLTITNNHFPQRILPDTQEEAAQSYEEVLIKLRIWPEMKYRLFDDFNESDIEEQPDGSFILTVSLPEDNWVHGFVLSFGEYAEVIEPEHLRKTINDKAKKISERYL